MGVFPTTSPLVGSDGLTTMDLLSVLVGSGVGGGNWQIYMAGLVAKYCKMTFNGN